MAVGTLALHFYLKKPRNYLSGPLPLYLRITVKGDVKELSISRQCEPSLWHKGAEKSIGRSEESKELNNYLMLLRTKTFEAQTQLAAANMPITAQALKDALAGRKEKAKGILEVFQHHNEQMAALVGQEFAPGTLERYKTTLEHTRSFIQHRYHKPDLELTKLDFEFASEYAFWLRSVRKCNHNTTVKYISNLKKITNKCVRSGWLPKDPFLGFKLSKREVERTALSVEQLHLLWNKTFVTERLEQVRDIFLFCCYTGLAYADIKKLKRSEIGVGVDGEQWIFTRRQKTASASRVPLLPTALTIMHKYKEHPQCAGRGRLLPVLSNQKMNAYLKEIADVCAIPLNFTFHIARHTFATTVTLSNGVPIETVSKMLGHKNLHTTQHYAKILDKKVSEDMITLKNKLVNNKVNRH